MLIYNKVSSVNLHNQILAGAPELLRISDAQNILLVGITLQGVA